MDVNLLHRKAFGCGTTNRGLQVVCCMYNLLERPLKKISVELERHSTKVHKSVCAASLQLCTHSTFNSAQCAIQRAPPKSIQDSNDSCAQTEWRSSTHKLSCGYTWENWLVTRFPPPSVFLGWGDVPRQWSCKQVQLQDLGQSQSTCHMWVGERQPRSECVGGLNEWHVRWTVFLFGKVCDWMFILGRAGAVCVAPITTSAYPPTRWDATMLGITWTRRWIGSGGPIAWPPRSPDLTPLDFSCGVMLRTLSTRTMVTPNILQESGNEVDYLLDICHATKGAYIEI
jgi:hypothetical protein